MSSQEEETMQDATQAMNGKAVKFRTIAEKRVSMILKRIRMIGRLSRRSSYNYTPEQVAKMFAAMRDELDAAEQKFVPSNQTAFSFDQEST